MFVCICRAVTESEIMDAVDLGATSLEAVGAATGAGTSCGTCHERIEDTIAAACLACPLSALHVA